MKYQKKSVVVEAFQWDGGQELSEYPEWLSNKFKSGDIWITNGMEEELEPTLTIMTLEGVMNAEIGDFIIKGVHDEIYPCKPDIFEETYMKVEENNVDEETITLDTYSDIELELVLINGKVDEYRVLSSKLPETNMYFSGSGAFLEASGLYFRNRLMRQLKEINNV